MGDPVTLAIAGFSVLNAANTANQGTAQAKAAVQQGEYQTQQIADNTVRSAGALKTSFLQSGLTLDGGPMAVLSQAFAKGQTDIGRIATNANNTAKNDINTARTKALESLASSTGVGSLGSSLFSGASSYVNNLFGSPAATNAGGFSFGTNDLFASDGLQVGKLYDGFKL